MSNNVQWSLIARYLTGSLTAEEERALMQWAGENEANLHRLKEAQRIWSLTGNKLVLGEMDTQEQWNELIRRIEADERNHLSPLSIIRRIPLPLKLAALVILSIGLYLILRTPSETMTKQVAVVNPVSIHPP